MSQHKALDLVLTDEHFHWSEDQVQGEAASPEPATEGPEWKPESTYLSSPFHSIFKNHLAAQPSGTTADKQACGTP